MTELCHSAIGRIGNEDRGTDEDISSGMRKASRAFVRLYTIQKIIPMTKNLVFQKQMSCQYYYTRQKHGGSLNVIQENSKYLLTDA